MRRQAEGLQAEGRDMHFCAFLSKLRYCNIASFIRLS
jgi:hypothetical protein